MSFLKRIECDFEESLQKSNLDITAFQNKTFLISGATGLLGTNFVIATLILNKKYNLNIKVIALVRNMEKAKNRYGDYYFDKSLKCISWDAETSVQYEGRVNYIIHTASQTSSRGFITYPVETIQTSLDGTTALLEMAKSKNAEAFIYLSTMEVYGFPLKGFTVDENCIGAFLPDEIRNCYPLSKLMCENLCMSYCKEYGVPIKIIRLTQTFGPGVEYSDSRIFAEFARNILERKPLVLKTKGETERSYLYTIDAIMAIYYVLINGKVGQIYNAANHKSYCSIAQMAELVSKNWNLKIEYQLSDNQNGYANTLYMNLDVSKLESLGWRPYYQLLEMFYGMIEGML